MIHHIHVKRKNLSWILLLTVSVLTPAISEASTAGAQETKTGKGESFLSRLKGKKQKTESVKSDTVSIPDQIVQEAIPVELPELDSTNFVDDTLLNVFDYMDAVLPKDNLYYQALDSTYFSPLDSAYMEWLACGLILHSGERQTTPSDPSAVSDQIYLKRIQELPNIIPATYNQIVRRYIDAYTHQRRMQVSKLLALSQYYFPIFEQALEEKGLPQELKYLPVIESALNPAATSRMGASGLWQFMYNTGKLHGLQINSMTDERRDPIKSTYAAMDYLSSLYDLFGDWNLAIAAYNCGPGNVRKAIARSGGKRNFWDIYFYLPRETRSYVPIFIAANYVMTYHEEHGIYPAGIEFPYRTDTMMIDQAMHFEQISALCKVPVDELVLLNPHFRNKIAYGTSEKNGILYLPAQYTGAYIHFQDSIPNHKSGELLTKELNKLPPGYTTGSGSSFVYRVRSGDTLSSIARRYHVTVNQLRNWNGLKSDFLRIGQRIIIYQ